MNWSKSLVLICLVSLFANTALDARNCGCPRKRRDKNIADYVVVGVGTAGAVVAKKLTDDKRTSLIALHVGENLTEDPDIKFSKNALTTVLSALVGPPYFENGFTIPQIAANLRELLWVIALPEGGASSVNAGAYCRGTNQVYDQWEEIAGPLWSSERINATYKELENYHGDTTNPATRGFHGPIDIRQVPFPGQVSEKFTQAFADILGVSPVLDYNDPLTPIGVSSQVQYTQKGPNGFLRVSSATAFLNEKVMTPEGRGVNGRKLRVLFNSPALRTIWKGKRAVGVEYSNNGKVKKVFARKGVIVCAGFFSSAFLMHSGVGPVDVLEPLGIPVVQANDNVGRGLADQTRVPILYTSNPDDTPQENINSVFANIAWLTAPSGFPNRPGRQLRWAAINPVPGLTAALFDLVQPLSRGRLRIVSADPSVPPEVDLGYFFGTENSDLDLYVRGFQTYIKDVSVRIHQIDPTYNLLLPDFDTINDPVAMATYIKETVGSDEHFQSHCRMADLDDGGVVDSTGHVYGVENLIVADNSVSPLDMDGSPMASAFLIGANIARILIEGESP